MSHVATIEIEVRDLSALGEACRAMGLELVTGQSTYRCWYNDDWESDVARDRAMRELGMVPTDLVPEHFTPADLGRCEHAIRVKDDADAYEIGIVARRDGRPGFTLLWDSWNGPLRSRMGGADGRRLKQEYALVVARRQALRQGFRVQEHRQADGSIQVRLTR